MMSAFVITMTNNNVYTIGSTSLSKQAYYLNLEAQQIAVAALLQGEEPEDAEHPAAEDRLLEKIGKTVDRITYNYTQADPWEQSMTHEYTNSEGVKETLGTSKLFLYREQMDYKGTNEWWVTVRVETQIDDTRKGNKTQKWTYIGTVRILQSNANVRLYNYKTDN